MNLIKADLEQVAAAEPVERPLALEKLYNDLQTRFENREIAKSDLDRSFTRKTALDLLTGCKHFATLPGETAAHVYDIFEANAPEHIKKQVPNIIAFYAFCDGYVHGGYKKYLKNLKEELR